MDEISGAPGAGSVVLQLGGNEVVLKPCADCAIRLSRLPGGLYGTDCVYSRVSACDMATMCEVIRAGAGASVTADPKLPSKVYEAGLFAIRDQLKDFLFNLGNRGRPGIEEKTEGADEDEAPLGSKSPSSATT
jgi:hypothetical protein